MAAYDEPQHNPVGPPPSIVGLTQEDFRAIEHRHDCVHRNGMSKDGKRLKIFTKVYVQDVADHIRSLIDRLETKIHGDPF